MALTRGMMGTGRRTGRARSRSMGLKVVGGGHASGQVAAGSGGGRRKRPGGVPEVALAGWAGHGSGADGAPSGWQGNGAQSGQGATELVFPGPALGKMQGEAACGVSRPAMEKKRRRRVLVVTSCSPRPMRAAQRARLCAMTWTANQAALAAKRLTGDG